MNKTLKILLLGTINIFLVMGLGYAADEAKPAEPESLQIEKLKLQVETLKLENQRLELKIKTMQMESMAAKPASVPIPTFTPMPTSTPVPTATPEDKGGKKAAKDMADKSQALAEQNATEEHRLVLDFSNGEMWYKGVHYKINDFKDLCEDQHWKMSSKFVKYDITGDSETRYRFQNMSLGRYSMQSRGVFTLERPVSDADFSFITPETITNTSPFGDFRKQFESPYYKYTGEEKDGGLRIITFKHGAGFLGFDDVLEIYFDKKDNFVKLRWGMLDKK